MIRNAIVPVAGLGTRLLPATKSQPKEMLPVARKPIVQYSRSDVKYQPNEAVDTQQHTHPGQGQAHSRPNRRVRENGVQRVVTEIGEDDPNTEHVDHSLWS